LRSVFGEQWQTQVKIALVNFGTAEEAERLMHAVQRLAPDVAYDAWLTAASMEELIHTLEQRYGIPTAKTIVIASAHAQPPGREILPQLVEPDKPIQIIVADSPDASKQEILSGSQAVTLAVEPGFFQERGETKALVHWEQWDQERQRGVLELEALPVMPEFSVDEEMKRQRLQEELRRYGQRQRLLEHVPA
jgi:hypothetical protein